MANRRIQTTAGLGGIGSRSTVLYGSFVAEGPIFEGSVFAGRQGTEVTGVRRSRTAHKVSKASKAWDFAELWKAQRYSEEGEKSQDFS